MAKSKSLESRNGKVNGMIPRGYILPDVSLASPRARLSWLRRTQEVSTVKSESGQIRNVWDMV